MHVFYGLNADFTDVLAIITYIPFLDIVRENIGTEI